MYVCVYAASSRANGHRHNRPPGTGSANFTKLRPSPATATSTGVPAHWAHDMTLPAPGHNHTHTSYVFSGAGGEGGSNTKSHKTPPPSRLSQSTHPQPDLLHMRFEAKAKDRAHESHSPTAFKYAPRCEYSTPLGRPVLTTHTPHTCITHTHAVYTCSVHTHMHTQGHTHIHMAHTHAHAQGQEDMRLSELCTSVDSYRER